jgi:hypothetical protein
MVSFGASCARAIAERVDAINPINATRMFFFMKRRVVRKASASVARG